MQAAIGANIILSLVSPSATLLISPTHFPVNDTVYHCLSGCLFLTQPLLHVVSPSNVSISIICEPASLSQNDIRCIHLPCLWFYSKMRKKEG